MRFLFLSINSLIGVVLGLAVAVCYTIAAKSDYLEHHIAVTHEHHYGRPDIFIPPPPSNVEKINDRVAYYMFAAYQAEQPDSPVSKSCIRGLTGVKGSLMDSAMVYVDRANHYDPNALPQNDVMVRIDLWLNISRDQLLTGRGGFAEHEIDHSRVEALAFETFALMTKTEYLDAIRSCVQES